MININFVVLGHLDDLVCEHLDSFDEICIFFGGDDDLLEYFLGELAEDFENFFKKLFGLAEVFGIGEQNCFEFALYSAQVLEKIVKIDFRTFFTDSQKTQSFEVINTHAFLTTKRTNCIYLFPFTLKFLSIINFEQVNDFARIHIKFEISIGDNEDIC